MDNIERLVIEIDQRSKSNVHRLNDLEKTISAIYDLTASVQVMGHNVQTLAEEIKQQGKRLDRLEQIPAGRWENIIRFVLSGAVGAFVGWIIK